MGVDFGQIGSAVGTVVGGVYGGPAGAAVGAQVGGAAGGAIGEAVEGDDQPKVGGAQVQGGAPGAWASAPGEGRPPSTGGPFGSDRYVSVPNGSGGNAIIDRCCCHRPEPGLGGLVAGEGAVETARYIISPGEDRVEVYDKMTDTSFTAWGDPHLKTSDNDKAQFHNNLAVDLPDGTTVSIKTTPKDSKGRSVIEAVAIMKDDQAVLMTGFNDKKPGVEIGNVLNNADAVERMWTTDTVLRAGHEVDDLSFANGGKEIVGIDPSQDFDEHQLDGIGGTSANRPNLRTASTNGESAAHEGAPAAGTDDSDAVAGASDAGGSSDASAVDGSMRSIASILWSILGRLEDAAVNKSAQLDKDYPADKDLTEIEESTMREAFDEIQRLRQMISQIAGTISNLSKSDHDANMTIVGNMRS